MAAFNVFLAEVVGSFIFCSVILSVKYHNGGSDILNGLAVGGTLFGMILTIDKISGPSLNPAVAFVQSFFQMLVFNGNMTPRQVNANGLGFVWIYVVSTIVGGLLAGFWSKFNEIAIARAKSASNINDEANTGVQYNDLTY